MLSCLILPDVGFTSVGHVSIAVPLLMFLFRHLFVPPAIGTGLVPSPESFRGVSINSAHPRNVGHGAISNPVKTAEMCHFIKIRIRALWLFADLTFFLEVGFSGPGVECRRPEM